MHRPPHYPGPRRLDQHYDPHGEAFGIVTYNARLHGLPLIPEHEAEQAARRSGRPRALVWTGYGWRVLTVPGAEQFVREFAGAAYAATVLPRPGWSSICRAPLSYERM